MNGHLEVVKFILLTFDCNPNIRGYEGSPPLHFAVLSGNIALVKYMIEDLQCNSQALDNFGRTPIMSALTSLPCLQYLREKGCDPTVTEMHGETLLHLVGTIEIVDFQIREGYFNPNTSGWTSRTPLHCAAECGHLNISSLCTTVHRLLPMLMETLLSILPQHRAIFPSSSISHRI